MPVREILARAGDPGPQPRHRPALRPLRATPASRPKSPSMRWDEAAARWIVSHQPRRRACGRASWSWPTARCTGPKLPGIPGVESFKGHSFHTSRWDYDYTGGDSDGGLDRAEGQARRHHRHRRHGRAVRAAPGARGAKQLYVFQRTPSSIDVRANRPTDPEWAASLQPGWQQQRMDNFNILVSGGFAGRGPGQRRLDRHHRQPADPGRRKRAEAGAGRSTAGRD